MRATCSVQKALAYFTTAVSYASKMFVKSTPGIQGHQEEGHEFNHLEKIAISYFSV